MSYFQSGYIRRIINFQWHNAFKATFYRIFYINFFVFLLIVANTTLINRNAKKYCYTRIGINSLIAIPIFYLIITYELQRLRKQGKKWFSAGWNLFTLFFLLIFLSVWALDGWTCLTTKPDEAQCPISEPEEELRMLIGKRKKK
jgi:hypothetical protein